MYSWAQSQNLMPAAGNRSEMGIMAEPVITKVAMGAGPYPAATMPLTAALLPAPALLLVAPLLLTSVSLVAAAPHLVAQ